MNGEEVTKKKRATKKKKQDIFEVDECLID